MVRRGVARAAFALGSVLVACGGRSVSKHDDTGDDAAGGTPTGGRNGSAGSGGTGAAPAGGAFGSAGTSSAGTGNGAGGVGGLGVAGAGAESGASCTPTEQRGPDGCLLPWWGTPLQSSAAPSECPHPYHPALLAYLQTFIPSCAELSGPFEEQQSSSGARQCCYGMSQRNCCGSTSDTRFCVDMPYFGDGSGVTEIPRGPIDDHQPACEGPRGMAATLPLAEAAARIIGSWLACGALPSGLHGDGMVFRADGTFHTLTLDENHELVETPDCQQGGIWGFLHSTGQLNMHVGDWTHMVHPVFTSIGEERFVIDTFDFVRARVSMSD